ncbi:RNA-directed DNA polymerase, eukaryota, reverse transcriptase zinc-binding domain protein, partial [Tanacetum coccineum]
TEQLVNDVSDRVEQLKEGIVKEVMDEELDQSVENVYFSPVTSVQDHNNEEGREVVVFDEEIVSNRSKKWELTLCGYFVGYSMFAAKLKYNLSRMWGKFGFRELIVNNGMYLFKFNNKEGLKHVLEIGPWMVRNKPLLVQQWNPSLCIEKKELEVIPLWIKLSNVPLEAWSNKGISDIASSVRKPVIMDQTTTEM